MSRRATIPAPRACFRRAARIHARFIQVQDGQATGTLQKVRLVMTAADATYLHTGNNTLSNELLGATVVVDETRGFLRCRGAAEGKLRGTKRSAGRIHDPFQQRPACSAGCTTRLAIDRSQHAAVGQGEIIAKHIANHAGGIPGMYDDLARFIHPQSAYTSACQLRTTGFDAIYLDSQFPNGSDGTMFEIEVIRWHTTRPAPAIPNRRRWSGRTAMRIWNSANWGNDKEAYRWTALADDEPRPGRLCRDDRAREDVRRARRAPAFCAEAQRRLDYEQWLRTLAYQALVGPADAVYTGSNLHNYRVCFRPHDGRAVYLPWDWDSSFQNPTNGPLVGASNLARVVTASADTMRRYYVISSTSFRARSIKAT